MLCRDLGEIRQNIRRIMSKGYVLVYILHYSNTTLPAFLKKYPRLHYRCLALRANPYIILVAVVLLRHTEYGVDLNATDKHEKRKTELEGAAELMRSLLANLLVCQIDSRTKRSVSL